MKLSQKISITLFFAIVVPLVIPVFLLFKNINEFQEKSLINLLFSISSGLVPSITFESKEGAQAYLQDTVKNIADARYAVVFTKDGNLFAEWGEEKGYVESEWVAEVLKGETFINLKDGNLIVGVPIFDTSTGAEEIIGALFLAVKKHSIAGEVIVLLLGVGAVSSAIFGIAFVILRKVSREISLIVEEISKSSEGNIKKVPLQSEDEIGQIATSWNNLVKKLEEVIPQIVNLSKNVEEISTKISSGSAELSQAVDHQISNLSEVAKSVEKFTETLKSISEIMKQVSKQAQESLRVAKTGAESSDSVRKAMDTFSITMEEVINTFSELSASVMKIKQIADTVREIAERTNLLALNASIEAARAGEMGRGFAVVADEVGELASRTNNELAKIEETTKAVLNSVEKVSENLQKVRKDFKVVREKTEIMKEDFTNILNKSEETSHTVMEVSQEVERHFGTMEGISDRVNILAQSNEQIGAMAFELAKVAEEMKEMSDKLYKAVEFFKVSSEDNSLKS